MKRALSSFALTLAVVVLCGSVAHADGFSLWPWGKDETKSTAKPRTAKKPAMKSTAKPKEGGLGLKWPKLPGLSSTTKKPQAPKAQSPSMLTKANRSTKNFFAKTKDVLTPASMKSQKVASKKRPLTGSHGVTKRAKPAQEKSGNILTSWWMPAKKEETKPKSPSEWLGGQRP